MYVGSTQKIQSKKQLSTFYAPM